MFTGIVEEIGKVKKILKKENLSILEVVSHKVLDVSIGDSVSVNGVCLSVVEKTRESLMFDVIRETLLKTTMGILKEGDSVNLERSLCVGDRFNGHIVTGHIDQMSTISEIIEGVNYHEIRIALNKNLDQYIIEKGSICIDGISLTISSVEKSYFSVYLVPITYEMTTLGNKGCEMVVNLETDILVRYMEKWNKKE